MKEHNDCYDAYMRGYATARISILTKQVHELPKISIKSDEASAQIHAAIALGVQHADKQGHPSTRSDFKKALDELMGQSH